MPGIYACDIILLESEMVLCSEFGGPSACLGVERCVATATVPSKAEERKGLDSACTSSSTSANSQRHHSERLDVNALMASLRAVQKSEEAARAVTIEEISPPKMDLVQTKQSLYRQSDSKAHWSIEDELNVSCGGSPIFCALTLL